MPPFRYSPGEQLQASTVNHLLENSGIYTNRGTMGGGLNSVMIPPTNEQGMADLTGSSVTDVKSHSVLYCLPKVSGGFSWSKTRKARSQAYYTLANEAYSCVGTKVLDPKTGQPMLDEDGKEVVSDNEGKRMVAVQAMIPGNKYVLHAKDDLAYGTACTWNGEKLVPASDESKAEFSIYRFQYNPTPPNYTDILFDERPRVTTINVQEESYYFGPNAPYGNQWSQVDGIWTNSATGETCEEHFDDDDNSLGWFIQPGWVPDDATGKYFSDNIFSEDGELPGYPTKDAARVANAMNKPVEWLNPPGAGYAEAIYRNIPDDTGTGTAIIKLPIKASLTYAGIVPRPNACTNRLSRLLPEEHGYRRLKDRRFTLSDEPAASWVAAKCMGVI